MAGARHHLVLQVVVVRTLHDQRLRRVLLHPVAVAVVELDGEVELVLGDDLVDRLLTSQLWEVEDLEEASLTVRADVCYGLHVTLPGVLLLILKSQAAGQYPVYEHVAEDAPVHGV